MIHAAHEKKERRGYTYMENEYVIEMLNITKEFPGIKANDNITLQLYSPRWKNHSLRTWWLPLLQ
jgi:hypothetical protein